MCVASIEPASRELRTASREPRAANIYLPDASVHRRRMCSHDRMQRETKRATTSDALGPQSRHHHHRHPPCRSRWSVRHKQAHTPTLDALAGQGVRFTHAYATAPITLTSHASLMTGATLRPWRPQNGMRIDLKTPTLADKLAQAGFATAGFVAAYRWTGASD